MTVAIKSPKKLIEVALPLDDINIASAREKSIRHGHPSTLHLWWARRPLAAARAVLFAQMVNDPGFERGNGFQRGLKKEEAAKKREELFQIIRELVLWKNTTNEQVFEKARQAIRESWWETCDLNKDHPEAKELFNPEKLPAFHDPFAGGGAIPLEAQRLGLESYASDLNPVAVLINKAMIEIPPKFAGQNPVGPVPDGENITAFGEYWEGAKGLAEDVRRYGYWMREEAFKKIGHLYPQIDVTAKMAEERDDLGGLVGQKLTVIAWIWARTVKSPDPAFSNIHVPLVSSFVLSSVAGKEHYVIPKVTGQTFQFEVFKGTQSNFAELKKGTKLSRGANFRCLLSNNPIEPKYIKAEGLAKRLGTRLMAIVAEGPKGRVYFGPTKVMETIASQASITWKPETELPNDPRNFWTVSYGLTKFSDLFTARQTVALTTFSDLIEEARRKTIDDAIAAGMPDDGKGINQGGTGATSYGDALAVYLGFAVDKCTDYWSTVCTWHSGRQLIRNTFGRQAIPMTWDFVETNIFSSSTGNFHSMLNWVVNALSNTPAKIHGTAVQQDAAIQDISQRKVVSSDPPYYDNIGYADLSDFFYVWLRRSLREVYPGLFATLAVPKAEELIATPYRHGNKEKAESFFLEGMSKAIKNLSEQAHPGFPVTIYYAFKQAETKDIGTSSTGWETFLEAVVRSGFAISGTIPMRTEMSNRMVGSGTNALASSIVLVCRRRSTEANSISRKDFQRELKDVMPDALDVLIGGGIGRAHISPVDLAQSSIGPGMEVFSKYKAILSADGEPMAIHEALILINEAIDDYLAPDSGHYDSDTLFCTAWFEQFHWNSGPFGEADTLSRAKGTSVDGVVDSGVLEAKAGKVRLYTWGEYPVDWDPKKDKRMPVWEALHHLIRALNQSGESAAAALLAQVSDKGDAMRQLAYWLYELSNRKGWTVEAGAYNGLIIAWEEIARQSQEEQTTF